MNVFTLSGLSRSECFAKYRSLSDVVLIVLSGYPRFLSWNKVLIILPLIEGRSPSRRGRGPVWSKIRAWGVRGPGFKSPRPHHEPILLNKDRI